MACLTMTTRSLQTLGPGGPDVVLAEHLQHHGARHPHGGRGQVSAQNQARHDEHADASQRIVAERHERQRRRPRPPDGGEGQDQRCQPEVGGRQADDGDRPPDVVGSRIAAHRRVDADRQPDQQTDHDRHHSQLEGCRQPGEYLLLDPPGAQEGIAQRAVQEDAPQPASILHVHRLIQSQHPLQLFTVYVGVHETRHLSRQRIYGIAREETQGQEHQDRQQQEGGYEKQNATDDIRSHVVLSKRAPGSARIPAPLLRKQWTRVAIS